MGSILPPLVVISLASLLAAPGLSQAADEPASAPFAPPRDTHGIGAQRAGGSAAAMGKDLA